MTWDDVEAHIRARYRVAIRARGRMGLLWKIGRAPDLEEQRELVELLQAAGGPHVCVMADVVEETRLVPLDAIRHNATLAVGALALVDHGYVMRAMLPLDDLTPAALDRALELVAHEAARIRHLTKQRVHPIPYED